MLANFFVPILDDGWRFIAIFAVVPALKSIQDASAAWAKVGNPFFAGDQAWWLGAIPFLALSVVLYLVGREKWMRGPQGDVPGSPEVREGDL